MSEPTRQWPRPLPDTSGLAGRFYAFCRQGELRFQRCRACGAWRHVPREICPRCRSADWDWERSCGRGRVFTWTVVVRPMHPAFAAEVPYAPVVVEMEEEVRLLSRVVDCPPEELRFGMPVEVVFENVDDRIALPRFRRVRDGATAQGGKA